MCAIQKAFSVLISMFPRNNSGSGVPILRPPRNKPTDMVFSLSPFRTADPFRGKDYLDFNGVSLKRNSSNKKG